MWACVVYRFFFSFITKSCLTPFTIKKYSVLMFVKFLFMVSLPLFLFFLTSCLYYSPPLSCCQVFFEKLQNKKAGHLPCFLVLRFKFFPTPQAYFIVVFTDFCQVCFRRLKISATRISCGTW